MYFLIATLVVCAYALNPEYANYDVDATAMKLGYATTIGVLAFTLTRIYSNRRDEYRVNRVKKLLFFLAIFDFLITIVIMDPLKSSNHWPHTSKWFQLLARCSAR